MADRRHIPTLDGIRGLAILLVIIHHSTVMRGSTAFDLAFLHLAHLGWLGVDLFFVLSGFLITGILLDARESPHYFRNFYARRVLRILPLYYALVLIDAVVLPLIAPASIKARQVGVLQGDELWYVFHLGNFAVAAAGEFKHKFLDVAWSLSIEEQFYLVWPMVVLLVSRRTLIWVSFALVLVALLMRVIVTDEAHANVLDAYVLTPCRMDGLAAGAILAIIARIQPSGDATPQTRSNLAGLHRLLPAARITLALGLPLVLVLSLVGHDWHTIPDHRAASAMTPMFMSFGDSLAILVFAALVVVSVTADPHSPVVRLMSARPLRTLGKYSYAIYLFHFPIVLAIETFIYGPIEANHPRFRFPSVAHSALPGQLLFYAIVLPVLLVLGWFSWRFVESRILAFKRYF